MPKRIPDLIEDIADLRDKLKMQEQELKDYIKAQRTRDTSIFLALMSAVVSAAVKYMFAV